MLLTADSALWKSRIGDCACPHSCARGFLELRSCIRSIAAVTTLGRTERCCTLEMTSSSAQGRLAALQRHLQTLDFHTQNGECRHSHAHSQLARCIQVHETCSWCPCPGIEPQETKATSVERPAPGGGPGTLTIVDNRTGKKYEVKVLVVFLYSVSRMQSAIKCSNVVPTLAPAAG